MTQKYGPPNEATPSRVIWLNNGPWKETIVYKEETQHDFPKPHKDHIKQFIDYKVPIGKFDQLAEFDGSVIVDRTKGETAARCDKEEMNFLALNLANDIVINKTNAQQARKEYGQQAMGINETGNSISAIYTGAKVQRSPRRHRRPGQINNRHVRQNGRQGRIGQTESLDRPNEKARNRSNKTLKIPLVFLVPFF